METKLKSNKDKIMLGVFLIIMLVVGFLLYKNFSDQSLVNITSGVGSKKVSTPVFLKKVNSKIDIDFLQETQVKSLYKVKNIPVEVGKQGNKSPFEPF